MANWQNLTWKHPIWDIVRYIVSFRSEKEKKGCLQAIIRDSGLKLPDGTILPLSSDVVKYIEVYFEEREKIVQTYIGLLRTESQAQEFCKKQGFSYGVTRTQNGEHHQSSKSMISAVNGVTGKFVSDNKLTFESDPQRRCIWFSEKGLHVTARNLDGAIPSLQNPKIIWEIKEYWGVTGGGSKMSDAVYECHLVGRELREFEELYGQKIYHVVFFDGKNQWETRKSDLARFVDLENQGLIDKLIVGRAVETEWAQYLNQIF